MDSCLWRQKTKVLKAEIKVAKPNANSRGYAVTKEEYYFDMDEADSIEYEDNDFFGRFSLYGVVRDKNIIQNILFPQLE